MRQRELNELVRRVKEEATPLKWFVARDKVYYDNQELFRKEVETLKVVLTPEHLNELVSSLAYSLDVVVLSPFYPPEELKELFVIQELEGVYGIITSQEKESKELLRAVEERLGLKIHQPSLSLSDLIGAYRLKRQIEGIRLTLNDPLLRVRGVMFVGLPGTGKSYSAKCVAGELDRWLIELNLSKLLEQDRPIEKLHSIFSMLKDLPPFILWIDEIDKMFTGGALETKLMGQLLTILEEFNKPTGYQGDGFFWATANNVKVIVERNPEFFRRFDYRFFMKTPFQNEAAEIFKFYLNKYGVKPFSSNSSDDDYFRVTEEIRLHYQTYVEVELDVETYNGYQRFIYTPAEIEILSKKLSIRARLNGIDYFTKDDLLDVIRLDRPIMEAMKDSIDAMKSQEKFFTVI